MCRALRCKTGLKRKEIFCPGCWKKLPAPLRALIFDTYGTANCSEHVKEASRILEKVSV